MSGQHPTAGPLLDMSEAQRQAAFNSGHTLDEEDIS